MKSKGFTLIELLAVIVILAIIALIAVPIILNIIDSSKDSANQRSVEHYADAIKNARHLYQVNGGNDVTGSFKTTTIEKKLTVEYRGSDVICDTIELYENGNMYLSDCRVDNSKKRYTYGTRAEEPLTKKYNAMAQTTDIVDGVCTLRFVGITDSLKYSGVGFIVTVYDENKNIINKEDIYKTTKVYTSVEAGGQTINAPEGNWFYTYTLEGLSANTTYYYRVATYLEYKDTQTVSNYKYYKISNCVGSAADPI